jgi:hypothetical protein
MIGEIDLYGLYVPGLLLSALLSLAVSRGISRLLARLGFYRLVWHPVLFDAALFIIVLGGFSLVSWNRFY